MGSRVDYLIISFIFVVGALGFVLATAPSWTGSDVNYTFDEDTSYYHNLSLNITGFSDDVTFAINTLQTNITWVNGTGTYNVSLSDVSAWIGIHDSSTGNLTINASHDNQTGFFEIPIEAKNVTDDEAQTTIFEFMINATNDFPNATTVNATYNLTQDELFFEFLNGTDEESHYPLIFNVSFNETNCTHAGWSGFADNTNCSLLDFGFNLTNLDNVSASMNFTANRTQVGTYYANISVMDRGENYTCPHAYCVNSSYMVNRTYYYTQTVTFNVFASLFINTTDCDDRVFNDSGVGDICYINVTTKGEADDLNLSSYSILRNYADGQSSISNTSWFYPNVSTTGANFYKEVLVNVTPTKNEVGNWTINFTAFDSNGDNYTASIYVFVNRTSNDSPDIVANLSSISSNTTSINLETTVNLSVFDDDILIPDKNYSYGGFNETHVFTYSVFNATNLNSISLNSSSLSISAMPVSSTNKTTAALIFTPNDTEIGNYTFNVTVNDSEGVIDFETFNITVLSNNAPQWNISNSTLVYTEGDNIYLNLSMNATDSDSNSLTYSFVNSTPFGSFTINSTTGIADLTATDLEVGDHIINITVSDGYLTNTTSINFTVYNVNDNPSIVSSITAVNTTPTSITDGSSVNGTEDNYTTFTLWVDDDDFQIDSNEKAAYYNESLRVVLTITGNNTNLFNFSQAVGWPTTTFPSRIQFDSAFTPNKTDIGNYTINITVYDNSSAVDSFTFYFKILEINHNPTLSTLSNQSTAVNRTFYYDINVSDSEDGNESTQNFVFYYTNLSGNDIFSGFFNSTSGLFNMSLNDSHEGSYHLNMSVNDSDGLIDYQDFWIYVYSTPSLTYPTEGGIFNLTENVTGVLNFTINHGVSDNLTYLFYTDFVTCPYNTSTGCNYSSDVLRYNVSYYGNSSSINWSFSPNFTDETYGLTKNLTLVVYPSSSTLDNASELNSTFSFELNITHTNANATFEDNIDDQSGTVGTNLEINMYDHFNDVDHDDTYYVENLSFSANINTSSITSSVTSAGVLILSATSAIVGEVNVSGSDNVSTINSNSFEVAFSAASTTTSSSTSSGGGSTRTVPVSLKLLLPDPASAYLKDHIELPVALFNSGQQALNGIRLNGSAAKDGELIDGIAISFSEDTFDRIAPGETVNLTMFVDLDVSEEGNYEVNVNARVSSPSYSDWGKLYITVQEGEDIQEKLVFTEEFLVDNPECLELSELVDEAKELANQGKNKEAIAKADEAISACRDLIAQPSNPVTRALKENILYRYLIISTLTVFLLGIIFYSYKRIKLRRIKGSFIQESIKNRNEFK